MVAEIKYERKEEIEKFQRFYSATTMHPIRQHLTLEFFGDLTGKRVVDFGCNDGHFLKKCLARGAGFCLGLDASSVGFPSEGDCGDRLRFEVQDCFKPIQASHSQFDYACTHGVVCLAKNEVELENICRNAFNFLKPGGKFFIGQLPQVAISKTDQETLMDLCGAFVPLKTPEDPDPLVHEAYGLEPAPLSTSKTGRPFTRHRTFTWIDYGWSVKKIVAKLEKVGFNNVRLLPISFPDGITEDEQKRLKSLQEPFEFIGAEKPRA